MLTPLTPFIGVWAKCTDHFPYLFCLAAGGKLKLNLDRIAEAVIIAVIIGTITTWALRPILLKVDRIEERVDKIYEDIYAPSIPAGKEGG